MTDTEASDIILQWDIMFCDKHIAPYKDQYDLAVNAMLLLAEYLMNDARFHGLCLGDPKNFDRIVKKFAPVCCYLGDINVKLIYLETGIL
jgi:hypothetical protein